MVQSLLQLLLATIESCSPCFCRLLWLVLSPQLGIAAIRLNWACQRPGLQLCWDRPEAGGTTSGRNSSLRCRLNFSFASPWSVDFETKPVFLHCQKFVCKIMIIMIVLVSLNLLLNSIVYGGRVLIKFAFLSHCYAD